MKRIKALLITAVLLIGLIGSALSVEAGSKMAASVKFKTTKGANFDNGKMWDANNSYNVGVGMPTSFRKGMMAKNITSLGATIYVPVTAMDQKNEGVAISLRGDFHELGAFPGEWGDFAGTIEGKYNINIKSIGKGKFDIWGWDNDAEKDIPAKAMSKFVKVKKGKGNLSKYYVITVSKLPVSKGFVNWSDSGRAVTPVQNKKYIFARTNVEVNFSTDKKANKGTFFIDDILVNQGSKKLAKITFSTIPTEFIVSDRNGEVDSSGSTIKVLK